MAEYKIDPSYMEVSERIAEFRQHYPDGSLRPLNPERPWDVVTIGEQSFIWYAAAAYRHPADALPGVGVAWEPFPGKTPYTKDSELQNAETSAWGRAIIASLASQSKKVASANEVRNRQVDQDQSSRPSGTVRRRPPPPTPGPEALERVAALKERLANLDPEHLSWARGVAKEEGLPKYDGPAAKPADLDRLEGIIGLAELDSDPGQEEEF